MVPDRQTFDEGYGNNVQFLEALDRRGQSYVAEVSGLLHGWLIEPTLLHNEHTAARRARGGRGNPWLAWPAGNHHGAVPRASARQMPSAQAEGFVALLRFAFTSRQLPLAALEEKR